MRNQPFDTIIISGGKIWTEFTVRYLEKESSRMSGMGGKLRLIAADRGLEFFCETDFTPDVIVGDFDSLNAEGREYLRMIANLHTAEILKLNVEKDDSDTQSAVTHAIRSGSKSIAILGATGSRFDHMLANLGLLMLGKDAGIRITIVDPYNYMELVESGTTLERRTQFGDYVSFFPINGTVHGLTLEGFRYKLTGHDLKTSDSGLTVSNEIKEDIAKVSYTDGTLLMIMSREHYQK